MNVIHVFTALSMLTAYWNKSGLKLGSSKAEI